MKKTLMKLLTNQQISDNEIYEFVKVMWVNNNPHKTFNEATAKKALNSIHGRNIIIFYVELIMSDPTRFNLNVTKLIRKDGVIIKYIINDL